MSVGNIDACALEHVAYNEITKYAPFEFLIVNYSFMTRVLQILTSARFAGFDWAFWRTARALWTFPLGRDDVEKTVALNDFVSRVKDDMRKSLRYKLAMRQHLEYYHPLAHYMVDTILTTGESLLTTIPAAFIFVDRQLNYYHSGLNNDKLVNGKWNGKVIEMMCKCYSGIISQYILGGGMIHSMRVLRAIDCWMKQYPHLYTTEAVDLIDSILDQKLACNMCLVNRSLQDKFERNSYKDYFKLGARYIQEGSDLRRAMRRYLGDD